MEPVPMLLAMGNDLHHPQSTSREIAALAPDVTFIEHWKEDECLPATDAAIKIARSWAVYGLEVGRKGLTTSSETLKTTSELLGSYAKKIEERQEAEASEGGQTA